LVIEANEGKIDEILQNGLEAVVSAHLDILIANITK